MDMIDPALGYFVFRISIFVLAIFVGYFVVWSVTPALHTPLMSVTNAISSVIIVGALIAVAVPAVDSASWTSKLLGFFAIILASVNIFELNSPGTLSETERSKCPTQRQSTPGSAAIASALSTPSAVSIWQKKVLRRFEVTNLSTREPGRYRSCAT